MKKEIFADLAVFLMVLILISLLYVAHRLPLFGFTGNIFLKSMCKGSAACFRGVVKNVIDGDTLEINGETVRLALVDTPEKWEDGYETAKNFTESICSVGSNAIVDEDDLQTSRSHRRIVAVVYCKTNEKFVNLNEELLKAGYAVVLTDFCNRSEFANEEWAKLNGCG